MNTDKQEQGVTIKVLYKPYFDWSFRFYEWDGKAKIINNQRLTSIFIVKATEKNIVLANEHNEILKQVKELNRRLSEIYQEMEEKIT